MTSLDAAYRMAADRYAERCVDTEAALARLATIPISLHCWQGDDVGGFENVGNGLGGGLAATGQLSGQGPNARRASRATRRRRSRCIPGRHRLNLHAIYGEFGGRIVDRDAIGPEHFAALDRLGQESGIGLDFNPTFFSHPLAADNFTLAHRDSSVRAFWIDHGIACRRIGGRDGQGARHAVRDECLDSRRLQGHAGRSARPARAADSSRSTRCSPNRSIPKYNLDAVEGKLFGIGVESYIVGSHEFYLGYAQSPAASCCASTPATSIRRRRSPTRSAPS